MMWRNSRCKRVLEIDLRRAEGLAVAAGDMEFREQHLSQCERCSAEIEALKILGGKGDSPLIRNLDDIARRRYVDEVLAELGQTPEDQTDIGKGTSAANRRGLRLVAAAIAVAAVLALVLIVVFEPEEGNSIEISEGAGGPEPVAGRVVLVTGGPSGASSVTVGDRVLTGQQLVSEAGTTVLSLPTGITASLGAGSRVTARQLDTEALELELEVGTLSISATPGRDGPKFSVVTRAGTVSVIGTVLAIEDRGDAVEVCVIRGRVNVADRVGSKPRAIGPAEVTVLGQLQVRAASAEESAALWKEVSAHDLLDSRTGAIIDVHSVPAGADVFVDGTFLGQTPMAAAVRVGHRRLELSLAGRESVREFVDVSAGETMSRAYDLQPFDAPMVAQEDDAGAEEKNGRRVASAGPAELLARAQELRVVRDWASAARAYRELVRRHPKSDEARSAVVSLAQINLNKLGRPVAALRGFDSYLSRTQRGPLALEALLGRARALRALGRSNEERAALERFLKRYPNALQAAEARTRLESLAGSAEPDKSDLQKK